MDCERRRNDRERSWLRLRAKKAVAIDDVRLPQVDAVVVLTVRNNLVVVDKRTIMFRENFIIVCECDAVKERG